MTKEKRLDKTVLIEAAVLQKRTQRRRHDLGPLRVLQALRIELYEVDDLCCGDLGEENFAIAEDVFEKASDRVTVQADGCGGQPTLALQIVLEPLAGVKSRRCRGGLLSIGGAVDRDKPDELAQREGIATSAPSKQPSITEIVVDKPGLDAANTDISLVEPSREILRQSCCAPQRRRRVPTRPHLLGKHRH